MITTEVIRDIEQFRSLRAEWSALLQASASDCLFLTWEWMFSWWQHLAGSSTLHLILVRSEGQLVALAPLALAPSRLLPVLPFKVLEFIASGTVGSDYLSIVIRKGHEAPALQALEQCLAGSGHVLECVRVEQCALPMVGLALQMRQAGWQVWGQATNHCPYITLSGLDWDQYLDTLHRSHRGDIVRKLKKLNKEFKVDFNTVATEPERVAAMATFIRLHIARWAGHGGSNAFDNPQLMAFHATLSTLALKQGWLRLHTLSLDGTAAAALYVFQYHGVCYYYQAAFNPDFARYSVGMLMLALCIRHAIGEHAREFDFLHDDEEYKYLWAREERALVRLGLCPPGTAGRLYRQALQLKAALKRLLAALPVARTAP